MIRFLRQCVNIYLLVGVLFCASIAWTQQENAGSFIVQEVDLTGKTIDQALDIISMKTNIEIQADENIIGQVDLYLQNINVYDLLKIILMANDLAYIREEDRFRVMTAEKFKTLQGYDFSDGMMVEIIHLNHVKLSNIQSVVDTLKSEKGKSYNDTKNNKLILVETPKNAVDIKEAVKRKDVPLETETIVLNNIKIEDIRSAVESIITKDLGEVSFDDEKNQITIVDTSAKIKAAQRFIEKLDSATKDITMDVKIVQVTLNDEHIMGVDWEAIVSDYKSLKFRGFEEDHRLFRREHSTLNFGLVSNEDSVILLDALDTVGFITEIFNGSIDIEDGKTTSISIKSSDVSMLPEEERQKLKFRKGEKVKLFLKPEFISQDFLKLSLTPEYSSSGENLLNPVSNQSVVFDMEGDSTIIIGSLFKTVTVDSTTKIPFLGDLPLVGFAFSYEGQKERKTEIIVFLKPNISD